MKLSRRFAPLLGTAIAFSALITPSAFAATDNFYNGEGATEIETITSGDYTYSIMVGAEDETLRAACIESYSGTEADLVIPSELDGLPVVSLGDRAFSGNYTATRITIPETVIGTGLYTFAGCTGVTEYVVDEDNPYYESIDGVLYADDGGYLVQYPIAKYPVKVEVPDGVYDIGNSAFAQIPSLEEVVLPDSVEYIGVWAFSNCKSLKKINIPEKVTALEDFCFAYSTTLTLETIPSSITQIGAGVFAGCIQMEKFTIPASVTSIGQAAFAGTGLKEITIPSSVTAIDFNAFGYALDENRQYVKVDDFVIRGAVGSEAQNYAADTENDFQFKAVSSSDGVTFDKVEIGKDDTTADEKEDGMSKRTKMILFGAGAVVLLGAGVSAAVVTTRKKKATAVSEKAESKEADEE